VHEVCARVALLLHVGRCVIHGLFVQFCLYLKCSTVQENYFSALLHFAQL